jgi:hypothetical protein
MERNGTVPHLELILVFSSEKGWNGTVPQNGIFHMDAEPSRSTESVECARSTAANRSLTREKGKLPTPNRSLLGPTPNHFSHSPCPPQSTDELGGGRPVNWVGDGRATGRAGIGLRPAGRSGSGRLAAGRCPAGSSRSAAVSPRSGAGSMRAVAGSEVGSMRAAAGSGGGSRHAAAGSGGGSRHAAAGIGGWEHCEFLILILR